MESINAGGRLRILARLAWPAIMEQLLGTMVSFVDTGMVGSLGASATAAVSVNAATIWLMNGVLAGVGVGYSVQVSNAVGAGDDEKVRSVIRQGLLGAIAVGGGALLLFQLLSGYIPLWLGAGPDVLPQAAAYLRFYTLAMPFSAANAIFSAILRCMGNTKTPLYFNAGANVLNIILNFFLIYESRTVLLGSMATPVPGAGMGVAGAAAASAAALGLSGIGLLIAAFRQGPRYRISRGDSFRLDSAITRRALYLGIPSIIERATINFGQIAMTYVVASLGTVALAANQIATTAEGLCYLPAFGVSYAVVALVGQAVGAKNREDADEYGRLAAKAGFLLSAFTGLLLFLFALPLSSLFNTDPLVVNESAKVLRIVSVSEPLFAVSIVLSGALRGANDVRFPMALSLICMWGVRILLAPILVYVFHVGLAGVWIAMAADLILRGILCIGRWKGKRWLDKAGLAP